MADTDALANLIAKYVDRDLLDRIAAEYRRGRILMVLTTNLDAQRPVVWNMGEIALNKSPAGDGTLPQGHPGVRRHSRGLPAGKNRGRGRRQDVR